MKKQDMDLFFKDLTDKSNSYSEESVRDVYFGLVKLITEGFRSRATVELPHLGKFSLRERKGRFKGNVTTGEKEFLPATKEIKFEPFYAWKAYVRKMDN